MKISGVLAIFNSYQSKDQATGVGEFLRTFFSSPRVVCKERRQGGGIFPVSLGSLSMAGSNTLKVPYHE